MGLVVTVLYIHIIRGWWVGLVVTVLYIYILLEDGGWGL